MSSQYGEHVLIEKYMKETEQEGDRFLDLGAYDGVTFSNTVGLAQSGMPGVLVEPDPEHFEMLRDVYCEEGEWLLVNAGVTLDGGLQEFWKSLGDIPSTFCEDRKEHFSKMPYQKIIVSTVTLSELLTQVGSNFAFVNIDVEGLCVEMLWEVLKQVRGLRILSVETDPEEKYQDMRDMIARVHPDWTLERIGGNLIAYAPK